MEFLLVLAAFTAFLAISIQASSSAFQALGSTLCKSQQETVESELAKTGSFLESLGEGSTASLKVRTGKCDLNIKGQKGAILVGRFQNCTITLKKSHGLMQDLNC